MCRPLKVAAKRAKKQQMSANHLRTVRLHCCATFMLATAWMMVSRPRKVSILTM